MKKLFLITIIFTTLTSCVSQTQLTIKNIDDNAIKPAVKNDRFVITDYSPDRKFGYDKDYPINIGFGREKDAPINISYFFNALLGEKNEKFTYTKIESCCPFPTKKTNVGAGMLDIYDSCF